MTTIRTPRNGSYASIFIRTFSKKSDDKYEAAGFGTAFLYEFEQMTFLVTNWHIIAGRHPEKIGKRIVDYKPTHFKLSIADKDNPLQFIDTDFRNLYDQDGNPQWIESSHGFSIVDLVAIRVKFDDRYLVPTVQSFAPQASTKFEPGITVCVIGYPFFQTVERPFPVWKEANIASEPSVLHDGLPYMLSLIHISEPTRQEAISYAVFCLKKKKN